MDSKQTQIKNQTNKNRMMEVLRMMEVPRVVGWARWRKIREKRKKRT